MISKNRLVKDKILLRMILRGKRGNYRKKLETG